MVDYQTEYQADYQTEYQADYHADYQAETLHQPESWANLMWRLSLTALPKTEY